MSSPPGPLVELHPTRKGGSMDTPVALAPRVLRVEEAARLLGVGRSLVYDLIREGRLRSVKVGSRRLIPIAAVDELLATGAVER